MQLGYQDADQQMCAQFQAVLREDALQGWGKMRVSRVQGCSRWSSALVSRLLFVNCINFGHRIAAATMTQKHWMHFAHEADVGIRGIGASKQEAFEQAALALTAAITDIQRVMPAKEVRISCSAPDDELLLVDWLNALIYEMALQKMLFGRFEVHLDGSTLNARAWGESVDVARHEPAVEPKGATYTELKVKQDPSGAWIAQCVVDV